MLSRVLLLAAATFLFVTVWTCQDEAIRTVPPNSATKIAQAVRIPDATEPAKPNIATTPTSKAEAVLTETVAVAEPTAEPLPALEFRGAEVVAGEYVVVDQAGETSRITIPENDSNQNLPHRSVYEITVNGKRYVFVRIGDDDDLNKPTEAVTTENDENAQIEVLQPVTTTDSTEVSITFDVDVEAVPVKPTPFDRRLNRKFDFTGYVENGELHNESAGTWLERVIAGLSGDFDQFSGLTLPTWLQKIAVLPKTASHQ